MALGGQRVDAAWLRAAVRPDDAAALANLVSVRAERLGEGVGMLTDLQRLHLVYAPGAPAGPATLVLKRPSPIPEVLEMARSWGLYQREAAVYRDLAGRLGMRTPRAWGTSFDPETHDFTLLLEDLAPAVGGDQTVGLSLDQARLALDGAAVLHARWWGRPELSRLEAEIAPFGEGPWVGTGERLAAAWPAFAPFVAERASPALLRVGEGLAPAIEGLMADVARAPRTLCHGDFRADNLMFAQTAQGPELVALDWQVALQARGAVDVGQLLGLSLATELRRAHESVLLRGYHERLQAGGVADYAFDAFLEDYRRALLISFFYVVLPGAAADKSHPRTGALYDSAVRRMDAVVEDHGLGALVG